MRVLLFLSVFVGILLTLDTYSFDGRVVQASKDTAVLWFKRTEYEIWKLRFYYGR